ncbi:uncharacterized protein LOC127849290 [Dreissena polymorpha]|uniref:uncharacterized protein LOC127849290 n=1 Tax=Dreissena polymorpha TaxID=45954 RepID=UPI0022651966|nr:uncharacterized protein LOC127849290 [Dreissena polymorpha]
MADKIAQDPGKSAFEILRRDKVVTKTIRKDLHDGRLIELTNDMIEELKSPGFSDNPEWLRGAFGKVYISKEEVPGFNVRVLLKEINLKQMQQYYDTECILETITNEKNAARLKHFGIVPLLGYHDDHYNQKYYFLSPYFENGDLFEAISKDRMLNKTTQILLSWDIRLKIMYQVSCAIDFMHTGNIFRGTILHLDIKSKSIVLDTHFNARLIDFDFARELREGEDCLEVESFPAYQLTFTKQIDYRSFGSGKYFVFKPLCNKYIK